MFAGAQDAKLTNETGRRSHRLSSRQRVRSKEEDYHHHHHHHHREQQLPTILKDAPHCVTCCCLSAKMKCSYRHVNCYESCTEQRNLNSITLNSPGDYPKSSSRPASNSTTARRQKQPGSGKKRITPERITVEELLREMNMSTPLLSDEEQTDARLMDATGELLETEKTEEDVDTTSRRRQNYSQRQHRQRQPSARERQSSTSKPSATKTPARVHSSCERWPESKQQQQQQQQGTVAELHQLMVPTIEDLGSDNDAQCEVDAEDERASSLDPSYRRSQQQLHSGKSEWRLGDVLKNSAALLGAGDDEATSGKALQPFLPSELEADEPPAAAAQSSTACLQSRPVRSEAHVLELKRVRGEFVERICEEVLKLQRLQRHLDVCSPHGAANHMRSVSTMTSARRRSGSVVKSIRDR